MIKVPLTGRGGVVRAVALLDDEYLGLIAGVAWHLGRDGYARRIQYVSKTEKYGVALHRLVLGLGRGDHRECDHINGNRLDNRRANLRIVTRAQNNQNVRHRVGQSGHRNVYWHPHSGLWRVQLRSAGRLISGGYFRDIDDAKRKAEQLRREHLPFAEAA